MVIRTMEMLFEYICLVLCIHKIAGKKVQINLWVILPFLMEWILVVLSSIFKISLGYKFIVVAGILLYIKVKVVGTWKKAVNVCGTMLIIILSLQVMQYYLFKFLILESVFGEYEGIIVNINICLLLLLWKEKYGNIVISKINKIKGIVISLLILIRILYIVSRNAYADVENVVQFLFETIGLSIVCILWISAEKEKNHKAREVQMYELYNKAFEEAIMTIRTRQHEFENHINAICCLQYTIADHDELLLAQEQYCEKVLQENKLNRLLKLNMEPVLTGFLYSKITSAEEKGIVTKYEIQSTNIKEKIAIYEFIELVGILFDNAVEALNEKNGKIIILKMLIEDESSFSVEIANSSPVYSNNEIEKFCSYGYSTKGEKRGIGLSRVKEIAKKYNAIFQIQNCIYDGGNYLSFKLSFT